ncbi:MAG TPA: glycine betaine ABC transporter substrate-binding protein [Candidatus Corynebacterium avicola]|uniref:Glycine betaine ABC transporter substrate-binding protein n=1 Tax=Candidatus Corynebacterium avicola TaxID=2838527 RepID=A0A9D1RNW5_9CORY|nr:glycine betaine ABC transporter substrate-binding protein [Candidatus Corynebacterium avicola]
MNTTARTATSGRKRATRTASAFGALLVSSTMVLTACGADNEGGGSGSDEADSSGESELVQELADCTPGEDSADVADLDVDDDKEISIAAFNGWDESFVAAHLLKYALDEDGYDTELDSYDMAAGYTGLADGDIDVVMDGWLPLTHADQVDTHGDDIEAQGCWYDNAELTIAVNEDSPAQEIGDLADMGDEYDNRLVGIEPGAGLTNRTQDYAIPEYGLDSLDFQISSTPAMLTELQRAEDSGDNIAVTLWRPHWAYEEYDVRDLEDPEGAMGGTEKIMNFSRSGLSEDNPYVSQLVKNLVLDDETLFSLEDLMFNEDNYGGENLEEAVAEWLEDNPDFLDDWKAGALGEE